MMNTDEWELVNDDGFVYKRKRRRIETTAALVRDPVVSDPEVELKERRKRQRKALVQLKEKYETEIGLWEQLSNTLNSMEHPNPNQCFQIHQPRAFGPPNGFDSVVPLLSQLFFQVEAQEAIIHDVSQLCEIGESLCSAYEEKSTQEFIDLPIWKSPVELMASLCED